MAENAVLVAASMILSFIESVIPIAALPIPGFKLGLPNIALTVAAYRYSVKDAVLISLCRIILTFFLFGNPTSFIFSIFGSVLSLTALALTKNRAFSEHFSFIGVSVICALAHNSGQLIASLLLIGDAAFGYTLPLVAASAVYGTLNGVILNLIPDKIYNKK